MATEKRPRMINNNYFFGFTLMPMDRNEAVALFAAMFAGVSLIVGISLINDRYEQTSDLAIVRIIFMSLTPMFAALAFTMPWYPFRRFTVGVGLGLFSFAAAFTALFTTLFAPTVEGVASGIGLNGVSYAFLIPLSVLALKVVRSGEWVLLGVVTALLFAACAAVVVVFAARSAAVLKAFLDDPAVALDGSLNDFIPLYKTALVLPGAAAITALMIGFARTWSGFFKGRYVPSADAEATPPEPHNSSLAEQERAEAVRRLKLENDMKEIELAKLKESAEKKGQAVPPESEESPSGKKKSQ